MKQFKDIVSKDIAKDPTEFALLHAFIEGVKYGLDEAKFVTEHTNISTKERQALAVRHFMNYRKGDRT